MLSTYVFVFLVISFHLAFLSITYACSSSPPFVPHALPTHPPQLYNSNYTWQGLYLKPDESSPRSQILFISDTIAYYPTLQPEL
jgi:hypothetical protein